MDKKTVYADKNGKQCKLKEVWFESLPSPPNI